MDDRIEKIDTTRPMKRNAFDLYDRVLELQEKMNEIIDVLNLIMMPDEDTVEEGEETSFLGASDIEI